MCTQCLSQDKLQPSLGGASRGDIRAKHSVTKIRLSLVIRRSILDSMFLEISAKSIAGWNNTDDCRKQDVNSKVRQVLQDVPCLLSLETPHSFHGLSITNRPEATCYIKYFTLKKYACKVTWYFVKPLYSEWHVMNHSGTWKSLISVVGQEVMAQATGTHVAHTFSTCGCWQPPARRVQIASGRGASCCTLDGTVD